MQAAGFKGLSGSSLQLKHPFPFFPSLYNLLASYLLFVILHYRTLKAKMEDQVYFGVPDSVTHRMRTLMERYCLHVQASYFLDLDAEHFITALTSRPVFPLALS